MTTVGYGDIYSDSALGKVYVSIMLFLGIILSALLVGQIVKSLKLTVVQQAVLGWMESYRIKEEIRVAAAKMIQDW
eukprot:CAMPEP_0175157992 /NCGR_PEP_ID=MMETSP0087-20121206/22549_1 /TAXON_ID=136419 /ORGANISM="Unknown Unknown, Strain D1" /LENGTH=75 /DNA_ID=CAMNT_0016445741 /DNA_START=986 /DNA_END=1210 /DNA_ORIENTATION=+